jgi:hypothetical protein
MALSVDMTGPALTAPVTIMLERTGDLISASYRMSSDAPWILLARDTIVCLAPR